MYGARLVSSARQASFELELGSFPSLLPQPAAAALGGTPSAMAWSALHSDLLRYIFSYLHPRDTFRAGRVCRTWWRVSNSPSLVCDFLAFYLCIHPKVLEERLRSTDIKPWWSLQEMCMLAARRLVSDYVQFDAVLASPFNPFRHSSVSPGNIARFIRAAIWTPNAFRLIAGYNLTQEQRKRRAQGSDCRSMRGRIYGERLDRLAKISLRLCLASAALLTAGSLYALFIAHWARTTLALPLRLAVAALPTSALCAMCSSFADTSATEFFGFLASNAAFGLVSLGAALPYFAEHLLARALLIPLSMTGFYFVHKHITRARPVATPELGTWIGLALFMWRVTLPLGAFLCASIGSHMWLEQFVLLGYSPWRWPDYDEYD